MFDNLRTSAQDVSAAVRVCVSWGRAIAVCEFPPILELGKTERDVIEAVCRRLRSIVAVGLGSAIALDVDYGNRREYRTMHFR